ncbi:unnamed protein product, partial [Durusdinium trenchii]
SPSLDLRLILLSIDFHPKGMRPNLTSRGFGLFASLWVFAAADECVTGAALLQSTSSLGRKEAPAGQPVYNAGSLNHFDASGQDALKEQIGQFIAETYDPDVQTWVTNLRHKVVAEHFHDDMDYNIVIGQNPLGLHLDDDTGSISYDWGSYGIHILLSRTDDTDDDT